MLQLGKCAENKSNIFLSNRLVVIWQDQIKFKILNHPYNSQIFKFKIKQKVLNKKDAKIRLDITHNLLFMKKITLNVFKMKKRTSNAIFTKAE